MIPSTPILGLEEVEPFPVPKRPSSTQEIPSTNIPLQSQGGTILKLKHHLANTLQLATLHKQEYEGREKIKVQQSYLLMAWMGGGGAQDRRAQA